MASLNIQSTTAAECLTRTSKVTRCPKSSVSRYFWGLKFRSDHTALTWLRNEEVHRKGAMHHLPDALSREFKNSEEAAVFEEMKDEWYNQRFKDVARRPAELNNWKIEDGMLYRYSSDALLDPTTHKEKRWRLMVPIDHRERVLRKRTIGSQESITGRKCRTTSASDTSTIRKLQGLMSERLVERPWAVIATDEIEMPRSKNRYRYLVVFRNASSMWVGMKLLASATKKELAQALEKLILFRWEVPKYIVSDNGENYNEAEFEKLLKEYGIAHTLTPPYHQQADFCKRAIETLKTTIAIFVEHDHRNWDQHLHKIVKALNTAV